MAKIWIAPLITLLVYSLTLHLSVPGGDAGELITVARQLGIAHPPGYPLYTLLAHLFSYLPFTSPAAGVNLLSALCSVAAVGLLGWTVRRWTQSAPAAWVTMGLYAFSPLVWSYSVTAEVFALNNLFVAAILASVTEFILSPSLKKACLVFFVMGLGFTNHHTLLFTAFPIAMFCLLRERALLLKPRAFASISASFFAGFIPYLYLPWRAAKISAMHWGDPGTLDGFLTHFLRREYGTLQLANRSEGALFTDTLFAMLASAPRELLFVGLIPLAYALTHAWKSRAKPLSQFVLLIGGCAFSYLIVFSMLANLDPTVALFHGIVMRFFLMPQVLFCALAGYGFSRLIKEKLQPRLAAAFFILPLLIGFNSQNQHSNTVFHDWGTNVLNSLPPGSLLLTNGDYVTNTLTYLQAVESLRPDIVVMDVNLMTYPWAPAHFKARFPNLSWPPGAKLSPSGQYGFTLAAFVEANRRRPLYACNLPDTSRAALRLTNELQVIGFVDRLTLPGQGLPAEQWISSAQAALANFKVDNAKKFAESSWEFQIYRKYLESKHALGVALLRAVGSGAGDSLSLLKQSIAVFESLLKEDPTPQPNLYRNLGSAYEVLSRFDPSAKAGMIKAWTKYLQLATDPDPDHERIIQVMKQAGA